MMVLTARPAILSSTGDATAIMHATGISILIIPIPIDNSNDHLLYDQLSLPYQVGSVLFSRIHTKPILYPYHIHPERIPNTSRREWGMRCRVWSSCKGMKQTNHPKKLY